MPIIPPFIPFASPLARTVSGNSEPLDLSKWARPEGCPPMLRVQSEVTAISGAATPTLTVFIEDSIDGGVTWNVVGTFAAQTAVSRAVIQIALSGVAQATGFAWPFNYRRMRARWTISGTNPNITFSVKANIL